MVRLDDLPQQSRVMLRVIYGLGMVAVICNLYAAAITTATWTEFAIIAFALAYLVFQIDRWIRSGVMIGGYGEDLTNVSEHREVRLVLVVLYAIVILGLIIRPVAETLF